MSPGHHLCRSTATRWGARPGGVALIWCRFNHGSSRGTVCSAPITTAILRIEITIHWGKQFPLDKTRFPLLGEMITISMDSAVPQVGRDGIFLGILSAGPKEDEYDSPSTMGFKRGIAETHFMYGCSDLFFLNSPSSATVFRGTGRYAG